MDAKGFGSKEWKAVDDRAESRWQNRGDRRLRFDAAPSALGGGSVLQELFRQWSRSIPRDQSGSMAREAGRMRVWLGWRRGGREFLAAPADVLTISEGGALVRLKTPLSALREVWVCPDDPTDADEGVLATTLDVTPVHDGEWVARLEFDTASADAFLGAESGRGEETRGPLTD